MPCPTLCLLLCKKKDKGMKKLLTTALAIASLFVAQSLRGQSFVALSLYAKDVVVTKGSPMQEHFVHVAKCDEEPHPTVFFIETHTSNQFDQVFKFYLGENIDEARATIRRLESTLQMPVGTDVSYSFPKEEECHIWVKEYKVKNRRAPVKALEFKYMEQGGFVRIDSLSLAVMKDALDNWDDEKETSFARIHSENADDINAEIERYQGYCKNEYYHPKYVDFFKRRVKTYKDDLRSLRKR